MLSSFHRVESNSRTAGGTGIGLALTLELVKTLGGTLAVESAVDKGSTFTVTLRRGYEHLSGAKVVDEPLEPVDLPPRAQNSLSIIEDAASWKVHPQYTPSLAQPAGPSSASIATSTAFNPALPNSDDPFVLSAEVLDLRDSTILLVDDNADLRQYIGGLLGRAFRVVEMEDGQAALEYCLREPPSLVVVSSACFVLIRSHLTSENPQSDVMMPRLDGTGLLNALRSNPSTALIPVIFLSAQAGPEARVEALLSGVDDYLVKPFQGKELLARVNSHLQLGKMRMELERRVEERTRALIESEVKYRGLADRYSTLSLLSPVGIFMADPFGRVNCEYRRFSFRSASRADAF
jgi:CheY-like chemotaxis protein